MTPTEAQAYLDKSNRHEIIWDDNVRSQADNVLRGAGGGGGSSMPNYADLAKQQMQLQQEANRPAIESLQAQIPETQARYATERTRLEGEKQPLETRYQNLLQEVTRQGQVQTGREQIATSREFGRRGISTESGIYGQTMNERLQPISQWVGGQAAQIGQSKEESLRALQNLISGIPTQETGALREIQNAMAELQAGGNQSAITNALQLYNYQQNAAQEAARQALAQKQADLQAALQQSQLAYQGQTNPIELELLRTQLKKTQQGSVSGGGGGGTDLETLRRIFG